MTWNIFDQDEYWMTKYFSKVKILDMTDLHFTKYNFYAQ